MLVVAEFDKENINLHVFMDGINRSLPAAGAGC